MKDETEVIRGQQYINTRFKGVVYTGYVDRENPLRNGLVITEVPPGQESDLWTVVVYAGHFWKRFKPIDSKGNIIPESEMKKKLELQNSNKPKLVTVDHTLPAAKCFTDNTEIKKIQNKVFIPFSEDEMEEIDEFLNSLPQTAEVITDITCQQI